MLDIICSVRLRTGSNPPDINRFQSVTENNILWLRQVIEIRAGSLTKEIV